jgi:hypothetical protein
MYVRSTILILLAYLIGFVGIASALLIKPSEDPTPPLPVGSAPRVEEPIKIAAVVTECWIRLSQDEIAELVEACEIEWNGYAMGYKDQVACYPTKDWGSGESLDPIWIIGVKDYPNIAPGISWRVW